MLTFVELKEDGGIGFVASHNQDNITSIEHVLDGIKIWQSDGKYNRYELFIDDLEDIEKITWGLKTTHVVVVYQNKDYKIGFANSTPLKRVVKQAKEAIAKEREHKVEFS